MRKTGNFLILRLFIFVGIFLALSHQASANVTVESTVDRTEIAVGEPFEFVVSVASKEEVDINEPEIANIDGLDIVNSTSSSSTSNKLMQTPSGMQFETERRIDFIYQMAAKKTGQIVVPSIQIQVAGKVYKTKSITLSVGNSSGQRQRQNQGQSNRGRPNDFPDMQDMMDEADQMFNQLLQRRGGGGRARPGLPSQAEQEERGMKDPAYRNDPKNPNEAFAVQLELDKTEVFEGEQIVSNWYILTRGNILSLDRLKFPELKGFWKEIIEEVPALNFSQTVINGIAYKKALLASHALFPIRAGSVVIDEFKLRASVASPSSPFSSFGLGAPRTYSKSSERVKINVKPLPIEGRPSDFSGAVGQFSVQAQIEGGNQFPINQPFSLKIRFEGTGNAKLIELPSLNLPANLEVYSTKNESKFFKNGKSYKEFEVLLIPRSEGEVVIPEMSFSQFDPQLKKYVSQKTQSIQIRVVAGSPQNQSASRLSENSKPVDSKKAELPAIVASENIYASRFPLSGVGPWATLFGLITLALAWKARKELGSQHKVKNTKQELEKRLKKSQALVSKGDWRGLGVEMTNTIYFVLGEVSGQGGANLEIHKLLDVAPPSVRRELGAEFQRLIEIFNILGFAPEDLVGKYKQTPEFTKLFTEAKNLLNKAFKD